MGELLDILRRDTPELIEPDLARSVNINSAAEPAWGAWGTITAGLGYSFVLCGLIAELMCGAASPGPLNEIVGRRRRWQVGTGGTPDVVALGHACLHGWGFTSADTGETYVFAVAKNQPYIPLNPILIPSGTAIKVRATDQNLWNQTVAFQAHRIYLVGYDAAKLHPSLWPLRRDLYGRGVAKCHAETFPATGTMDFTPSSAGGVDSGWSWGNWTELVASLDENMLITGASLHPIVIADQYSCQVQIGTGADGYEIPRAAMGLVESPYTGPMTTQIDFPYPFVAFKGERLVVRGAAWFRTDDYSVAVQAARLHKD